MADRTPHRDGLPAASALARRLRALLEPGDAAPPRPRAPRLDRVRRSSIAAAWDARAAVRAGLPLDDFLRARLARYRAKLSIEMARLPLSISVEAGQVVARPAPGSADAADPAATADPLPGRSEANELEVRIAILDGEIEAARRRADELAHRFAADVAAGLVASPSGLDATAEQMGRPPVRGGGPRAGLLALAVSALAAEAWQIAVPLLAGAGVDPSAVATVAQARPVDVASLVLFAGGVTAALVLLAGATLSAGEALVAGVADAARRRWLAGAGAATGALAALVAVSVAALPRPFTPHPPSRAALALLLLAVPLGAAFALRIASRLAAARDEELARALAWDRERARALSERGRRLEELRWAEDEQGALERQREAARRRIRELGARAALAAWRAAAAAQRERDALARLAQDLATALELDRYAWIRRAVRATAALPQPEPAARRRPEPRPEVVVEAAPRPPTVEVEPGRLAS